MEKDKPRYYISWEEDEGAECKGCFHTRSIDFEDRAACTAFVASIHKREGYQTKSLRVITGFELDIDRS